MTVAYPHIADRLFGPAHAIEPNALRAIVEGPIGRRVLSGESIGGKQAARSAEIRRQRLASVAGATMMVAGADGISEYALTEDGIAILSIAGVLSRRYDLFSSLCGWTTYDGLGASLQAALNDERVNAILFDIDSPGGEAAGMLDIADQIIAGRDVKPIWAVADSQAASAAYALGASADRLFLPRLAQVGSIGAVIIHVDQSAQDQTDGLKYSAIFSGSRKLDGWPHAALSSSAREAFQTRVDHVRQSFAALVGRQGRISSSAALKTEAEMFSDADAVQIGLADAVGSFDQVLSELSEFVQQRKSSALSPDQQDGIDASAPTPRADAPPNPWDEVIASVNAGLPAHAVVPQQHTRAAASLWDEVVAKTNSRHATTETSR